MARWNTPGFLIVCVALAAAFPARAENLAETGGVALGVDRLFGLHATRVSRGSASLSTTSLTLFSSSPGADLQTAAAFAYTAPRLAIDFDVFRGLTVGGALGFGWAHHEAGDTDVTSFVAAPRVGYVVGITRATGLWFRGGLTYFRVGTEAEGGARITAWGLGFDVEPTFVVTPWTHFGFTAGLIADVPLAGNVETKLAVGRLSTSVDQDLSVRDLGIVFGMLGIF